MDAARNGRVARALMKARRPQPGRKSLLFLRAPIRAFARLGRT
jgi:hypothetical protein